MFVGSTFHMIVALCLKLYLPTVFPFLVLKIVVVPYPSCFLMMFLVCINSFRMLGPLLL